MKPVKPDQDTRDDVCPGYHSHPAERVEQRAQRERPEEVAGCEDRQVITGLPDTEERRQCVAVGEEEGVVEEGLAHEEGEAEGGAPGVQREDGLGDEHDADRLALPDRDRLGDCRKLASGLLVDGALDVLDDLLAFCTPRASRDGSSVTDAGVLVEDLACMVDE